MEGAFGIAQPAQRRDLGALPVIRDLDRTTFKVPSKNLGLGCSLHLDEFLYAKEGGCIWPQHRAWHCVCLIITRYINLSLWPRAWYRSGHAVRCVDCLPNASSLINLKLHLNTSHATLCPEQWGIWPVCF